MLLLANIVRTVAAVVVGILVVAIVLVLLSANPSNDIVSAIHDAGSWLAGPFKNLFHISGHKANVAVNWGIAAIVYSIVAAVIVRLLTGIGASDGYGRTRAV